MSQLKIPGLRSEIVRLTLPKVNAGAAENAAGLIQFGPPIFKRSPTLPPVAGSMPVAFGRWLALNRYWLLSFEFCAIWSGKPDEITFTTLICHPPAARSTARLALLRKPLPVPIGKS